jgi:hypothetical protein
MVLSPSAGSSQRVTGLKWSAKVSVPSGAAIAGLATRSAARHKMGARRRTSRRADMDGRPPLSESITRPPSYSTAAASVRTGLAC